VSGPARIKTLILLRHGRTAWNAQRRYQGQADPPLDDVGRAQALEAAPFVAALQPALVVTSDAVRAVQTAAPLGELTGLPVTVDGRLRERSLGHWEGLTRDEVALRHPEEYADWLAGREVSRRGGESREQVAERALAAFRALPPAPTVVLVTHSATALALCAALLGMDQQVHTLGPLANCHWSELTELGGDPQRNGATLWRLRAHNVGAPGSVLPHPVRAGAAEEDAPDADA
jgi:probable phosphoglycerate mutase